jgi:hypothetical protein
MKMLKLKEPRLSRDEFSRRAKEYLKKIQDELMPDQADKFVAINMQTGEYVLSESAHDCMAAYRVRWPNVLAYRCRVDGGPATTFHGR